MIKIHVKDQKLNLFFCLPRQKNGKLGTDLILTSSTPGAPALPRILSPRDFLAKKKIAPNLNNTEKQKLEIPRT